MSVVQHGSRSPGIGFAAAALLAALLAGCGTEAKTSGTPTTPTATAPSTTETTGSDPQAAFDPCAALTPQFLGTHQWDALPPSPKQNTAGGISWKGCRYVAKAGYGFTVETTNGTLDQVRDKFPAAVDISINGRKALRYAARPDVPGGCSINVEMKSGSLYLLVDDPTGKHPRKLSPCDTATEIAQAVAPLLSAGS
ncbi:DUF3558 domain-containing protein [Nocardia ninae]|uniref:DUF3558 domain-containing protein n=1 Tax=Nocardia ninae NBRC 108245 TaxID=1210091 RepID=A0A511MGC1_9NOCA|nr:DUF3558 domain-containing protein [Nocardia ninae]GEM39735.1 hypothetical protein NN4_42540 [Nocardia ninae NBRC 108245]